MDPLIMGKKCVTQFNIISSEAFFLFSIFPCANKTFMTAFTFSRDGNSLFMIQRIRTSIGRWPSSSSKSTLNYVFASSSNMICLYNVIMEWLHISFSFKCRWGNINMWCYMLQVIKENLNTNDLLSEYLIALWWDYSW